MSTGTVIVLVVAAAVVVAALALVAARPAMRSGRLRRRFGPEYDRVVARHEGNSKAAEKELEGRLRRYGNLEPQPLSAEAREQYVARWAGLQERFVDAPAETLARADRLLGSLMRDRGYPVEEHDEQMAALSVRHARTVQSYRDAQAVAHRARDGRASTEELRTAVVRVRELFEELVEAVPADTAHHAGPSRRGARTEAAGRRTPGGRDDDGRDRAGGLLRPGSSHRHA